MRRHRLLSVFALAWLTWCCRGGEGAQRAAAAPPGPGTRPPARPEPRPEPRPEAAALLVVESSGDLKTICLPSRGERGNVFPGIPLLQILDALASGDQLQVAALAAARQAGGHPDGKLLLLASGAEPRVVLDEGVRCARFSPTGDALLVESTKRQHVGGGAMGELSKSHVLELPTGKLQLLGEYADPRWEADGQHVRATGFQRKVAHRGARRTVQWLATRVRWDRASGAVLTVGPGSSQVPSPQGTAVAWLADEWTSPLDERCQLSLGDGSSGRYPAAGPFCQGVADDRGIRWSPDGRWLAFASFAAGSSDPLDSEALPFVDVVAAAGGRHPGLAALLGPRNQIRGAIAARPTTGFPWLDWSPSQGQIAVQDSDQNVQVLDLSSPKVTSIGRWRSPVWSPRGGYLLVRAPLENKRDGSSAEAFVLPGGSAQAPIPIGMVRDVRWVLSTACANQGGK